MRKRTHKNLFRTAIVGIVVLAVMLGVAALPYTQASGYGASYIDLREDISVDYSSYIDSTKMFPLPEHISDDDEISVIIILDQDDLMSAYELTDKTMSFMDFALESERAEAVRDDIRTAKSSILMRLNDAGVSFTQGEDYDTVLSGFELLIRAGDFSRTCSVLEDGEGIVVGEVYRPMETKLVENAVNVYETGIFNSAGCGYDGTGMVVAVLDTGLDSAHTAFSTSNFTSGKLGLTYDDVAAVVAQTTANKLYGGLSVDDVYINEKVPYGYDYADNDPDVYSTHNNHGTHVSGVIVGKDDVITGVAPNAQLVSMKIFSDVMDTARSSWILSALEDCVVLGVDVINMSLGTACGFSRESDEEILCGVYDKIRAAGISVVAAASNSYNSAYGSEKNGNLGLTSNPDTGTVGSPSTYDGVLSVASISGTETPYMMHNDTIIYFIESNNAAAIENNFVDTLLGEASAKDYEYVVVPGVGRSADYTGLDVNGKIVLVRRGDNTFEEKALIAEAKGAAGIVIYNNVSGDIKMNVGNAKIAVCSISQNDGEMLAALGSGTLKIDREQTSGPFISDFSSWGPAPSLEIKPEITAHGGNILSSVTGGSYDRLSGTSMACPNLAGVVVLLRQYVVENFPEIAKDNSAVNAMVNRLMMSTADIALNTNGLPYAVRKQGAGLANLSASIGTTACIITKDAQGKVMDTSKLELGDDPQRNGVYTMSFAVSNFGKDALTYDIGAYVMTEGVSETKTNAGETTVTEEAYLLDGASVEFSNVSGGELSGTKLTVAAGKEASVTVTITLSDSDKAYLDTSFENGMYVEGFVTLKAVSGTEIDLNVPYLAFYGDWTKAPLFDLTYFDTNADELDDAIPVEDKTLADVYASRPIGGVYDDFVSYLGSYYFLQDPADIVISANENYIALSNKEGAIHSLRFVWAGLLRNAAKIEISITDDTTGEVVFETVDNDVRKSYGDGGSIYPANIEVAFDTQDFNLSNNAEYTVRLVGYLDYGNGGLETNENNVFEFPLTIDFEAPTLSDVSFYYEYDKTQERNRLYAKAAIYDNHYAMCAQLGYVTMETDAEGNDSPILKAFEQFMTPIYSQKDSVTYVTFELTDYIWDIKEGALNPNSFVITCYDYALNYATYEIGLPNEYVDFYFASLEDGLTLSPNEIFSLEPLVYPNDQWAELLEYTSSRPSVVRIVNNKAVAVSSGKAMIKVRDPLTNKSITFPVTVLAEGDDGYRRYDKPVADVFKVTGYNTLKAYYQVDSKDKEIGDTGDTRFFEGNYSLSMYPSESVRLNFDLDAYFPNDTTVEFESSNESIVTIDGSGAITAVAEGFASVTVKIMMDGRSTYYSESVSVEVKDPYVTNGATLTHYFGNGGLVVIPQDLSLREIGSFAFANFEYVLKTEEELAFDDAETSKQWYIGETTITKVIIPEGVTKINAYAFANLTGLEEIVLPSTLESIEYGAFFGCSSLQKLSFSSGNNLKIVNQNAFENCDLQGTIDLSAACVISDYAFAGNQELKGVTTSDSLLSIGQYAFAGCKDLETVTITSAKVKYGPYAFTGCESLESFYVNASVLPEGMFYECDGLKKVSIGPDVNEIGEFAFRDTAVSEYEIMAGNKTFKVLNADYILSADGKQVVAVSPVYKGVFTKDNLGGAEVTSVAGGAFSHNTRITAVELPSVTKVGDYAFGSSDSIASVTLGKLTHIGEYAFFETAIVQLPKFDANTSIGRYAFAFTRITQVNIPDGMVIEEGVFSQCKALETVVIGNNVTIGDFAFNMDKDESFAISHYDENGKRYFYYTFSSALTNLTIGSDAVIGENAFAGHASLASVTLGANASIGKMAFYNMGALKEIDLSKVASIGDYAFSGDVYYICLDESMAYAAVSEEGKYLYTYHAAALESVDLASIASFGEYAFAYCRELKEVALSDAITQIPQYGFAGCVALETIDLSRITVIGDYAFIEDAALVSANMSAAETIGEYAFVYCDALSDVTLNTAGTHIEEGAFSYCEALTAVENLNCAKQIGPYGFAYTAIVDVDLSGAELIDDFAFLKEELTPFRVTLGDKLTQLGNNPFAMCLITPFNQLEMTEFNGVAYETLNDTFELSDRVRVIEGSLYADTINGMELITFAGTQLKDMHVADGTVRIGAYAFCGSDVSMVTLPYTVTAIGHKAFYLCDDLETVVFNSFEAPILEEEFDAVYYESMENLPGTGDFGTYMDYSGNEVQIIGTGLIPYYMWNSTDGMYSNVFYGANFVDYVGNVENKLIMVRPVNGKNYDSYILNQYFDLRIDGAAGADDVTLAAIAAIKAIPARVSYEDKHLVEEARAAYTKIATTEQQALVTNYADLISAEQRITALTPTEEEPPAVENPDPDGNGLPAVAIGLIAGIAGVGTIVIAQKQRKKKTSSVVTEEFNSEDAPQQESVPEEDSGEE